MELKLINKIPETSDVTSFIWQPQENLDWKAGQFLHYVLPHASADKRGTERWFTIAAAPEEKTVRLTTRFAQEKGSTFKKALQNLPIGAAVKVDPPEGNFIVEDPKSEFVFLAGGIGITPFRSILKDLDYRGEKPKINLLYSNRNPDFVYKEELEGFKKNNPNLAIHYLISPQRIDEESIKAHIPDLKNPIFYLSGPEPMVEALGETLKKMGVWENHLKQDWFPGYPLE